MHLDRQLGKAINKTRQLIALFRGWMKHGDTASHAKDFWRSDAKHDDLWIDVTKYAEDKLDTVEEDPSANSNAEHEPPWTQQP